MIGKPYSSLDAGMGPLMLDMKNKICQDCELFAHLEDGNGMVLEVRRQTRQEKRLAMETRRKELSRLGPRANHFTITKISFRRLLYIYKKNKKKIVFWMWNILFKYFY